MPEAHSRLAKALAEAVMNIPPTATMKDTIALVIDRRLAEIRKLYEPEQLALCPIVTHHRPGPCAFCNTAAMRAFILAPPPCRCAKGGPSVTVDDGGSAHWIHDSDCGLPHSPADGGPAETTDKTKRIVMVTGAVPGSIMERALEDKHREVNDWAKGPDFRPNPLPPFVTDEPEKQDE